MKTQLLIVTRSLPFHGLGGMEVVAWDVARELARKDFAVTVLTTQAPSLTKKIVIDSVEIHPLLVPSGRYSSEWWRESARVFSQEYADSIDVVLSVSAGGMSIAKWAKKNKPGIKLFVQAHGTAWGEIVSKLRTKSLLDKVKALKNVISLWKDREYKYFDGFIAVGPKVLSDLNSIPTKWIIGGLPCREISNGIDTALFSFNEALREDVRKKLGFSPSDKVVVSASRLHPQKGVAEGLKGFALAVKKDADLRYIIIGAGADEVRIKALAVELGLTDKVRFLGALPRERMPEIYSGADIFLFTTLRQEGLALNVMEALACGLPCIVSNHITLPEMPTTAVDPQSPGDIAAAIVQTARRQSVGRTSLLSEKFYLDNSISLYKEIFQDTSGFNPQ